LSKKRDQEQEQARELVGKTGEVPTVYSPDPSVHTPNAASGEQHRCGIDHWLEDHPPTDLQDTDLEPLRERRSPPPLPELPDAVFEPLEPPEPPEPPKRRKIWDRD
jgi:hypothetical protein